MPSLATGDALTSETWADFVKRLHHDCRGEGVNDHCTADAIFTVEAKRIVSGIDRDYSPELLVYCEDSTWYSPQEYWDAADEGTRETLNAKAVGEYDHREGVTFLGLGVHEQWDVLETLDEHHVVGYVERWDHINSHFTKDAAEAFIKRKKHDYPEGLRVYVDAQLYCWEFNSIKEAILSGRLTLTA